MGGKSPPVVGYRYRATILFHLCVSTFEALIAIRWDNRTGFVGPVETGRFTLDAEDLFGTSEGGVSGSAEIFPGGPLQSAIAYLRDVIGLSVVPAYRWCASCLFENTYLGNNKYLKPPTFIVRAGLADSNLQVWYPETAEIPGDRLGIASGTTETLELVPFVPAPGALPLGVSTHRTLGRSSLGQATPTVQIDPVVQDGITLEPGVDGYYIASNGGSTSSGVVTLPTVFAEVPGGNANGLEIRALCEVAAGAGGVTSGNVTIDVEGGVTVTSPNGPFDWQPLATDWRALPEDFTNVTALYFGGRETYLRDLRVELRGDFGVIAIDRNPAHAIRKRLTDPKLGRGFDPAVIDDVNFRAAADLFFAEGLGISAAWDHTRMTPRQIIEEVSGAAQCDVIVNRQTGLWQIKPVRAISDPSALPLFGDADIIDLDLSRELRSELPNQVTIEYFDWSRYGVGSVTIDREAAVGVTGRVIAEGPLDFRLIRKRSTAQKIAARELAQLSVPKLRGKVTLTRAADLLSRGDNIRLASPFHGLSETVFRVTEIDEGDGRRSQLLLDVIEAVFSAGASDLVVADAEIDLASGRPSLPVAITDRLVQEAPYYALARQASDTTAQNEISLDPTQGYLQVVAAPAGRGSTGARIDVNDGNGFVEVDRLDYTPAARLGAPLTESPFAVTVSVTSGFMLSEVEVSDLAQIGDEIVRIDAVDVGASTMTLARGCLDTLPGAHLIGAPILVWDRAETLVGEEYGAGELLSVRLRTIGSQGVLAAELAPVDSVTLARRAARPLPPGRLQLAGQYAPITGYRPTDTDAITWAHRNRLTQTGDTVPDFTAGDVTPEDGLTYRLDITGLDEAGVALAAPHHSETTDLTSLTPGTATMLSGLPAGATRLEFRVTALRDGLESRVAPSIVTRLPITGDAVLDEGGNVLLSEGGAVLILEDGT